MIVQYILIVICTVLSISFLGGKGTHQRRRGAGNPEKGSLLFGASNMLDTGREGINRTLKLPFLCYWVGSMLKLPLW